MTPVQAAAFAPASRETFADEFSPECELVSAMYRTYGRRLLALCRAWLSDRALAEDVVQETFLRAFRNIEAFDRSRPVWPWLRTIARNLCIDEAGRRKEARSEALADEEWEVLPIDDVTSQAVIGAEAKRRLERALAELPARQRRVLLLRLIDGWDYASIASAEDTTVGTVKSIVFRARDRLRLWYAESALALLPPIFIRGRRMIRRRLSLNTGVETSAARLEMLAPGVMDAAGILGKAIAGFLVVLSMTGGASVTPAIAVSAQGASASTAGSASSPAGRTGTAAHVSVLAVPTALPRQFLDPRSRATPDNTQFSSIAASPNYTHDHTLFASGSIACPKSSCMVLFVSHDGGGTWTRLPSDRFAGIQVFLPPTYPMDSRIFAAGRRGLQVSDDGGATFKMLAPLLGGASISPGFDASDPRILVATSPVVSAYEADPGAPAPATLGAATEPGATVAFSPNYLDDQTVFVGSLAPDTSGVHGSLLNRCVGATCSATQLDATGTPSVRFSPRYAHDGTMLAFTPTSVFRSTNFGATFTDMRAWVPTGAVVADAAIISHPIGPPTVVVTLLALNRGAGTLAVLRSSDMGLTWLATQIPFTGFEMGAARVIATADRRILVSGAVEGLACSADYGRTWNRRC